MIFLLVAVFIKEHVALIAILIGIYSLFYKKSCRWVFGPVALGVVWGLFSLWLIFHFQKLYGTDIKAAWFFVGLKDSLSLLYSQPLNAINITLSKSNIGNWHIARSMFLLILPLGGCIPFFSAVSLLGVPELIASFLSDRPAMLSPIRHYNIISSCFLLIACVEGVKKIAQFKQIQDVMRMKQATISFLLSVFIFSSVIIHSFTWLNLTVYVNNPTYVRIINKAIATIPPNAFVGIPRHIAVHVSSRRQYFLLGEAKQQDGEYILIDNYPNAFILEQKVFDNYVLVFNQKGVMVLKKKLFN